MSVTWTANLDPNIVDLVDTAFRQSWHFGQDRSRTCAP